jgi:hypothetical protein
MLVTVHVNALDATNDTAPTPAPIMQPSSTNRPTYLIIKYVVHDGPLWYQDCGPALVTTVDYLTFYAAGQADSQPLAMLGYEILHTYQHATSLIGARAHYGTWKSALWRTALNRAVMRIDACSAIDP